MPQVERPKEIEVRNSWERLLMLPRRGNPAVDMTGANCPVAQPSKLWFLQSTIGGTANRACTIPPEREIVCNVISCELSYAELPGQNLSHKQLLQRAQDSINLVDESTLRFIVDKENLISGKKWQGFRVATEPTDVTLPDGNYDNLFRAQGGFPTVFAADGYYVKLTDLSPGPHTLYFGGVARGPGNLPIFETAVNYNLTQL